MNKIIIAFLTMAIIASACIGAQPQEKPTTTIVEDTDTQPTLPTPPVQPPTGNEQNNYAPPQQPPTESGQNTNVQPPPQPPTTPTTHTVKITASGFEPKSITISSGDTVTWMNEGSSESWPASAVHPTHTVYPNSDIKKCGTSEKQNIFDACMGIKTGQTYSFKFTEKGSWNYHDHLKPSFWGTVVVE